MFRLTRARLGFAFWVFFILAGAVLIAGLITSMIFIDLLLSGVVIAIGFHGLLEEYTHRENRRAFKHLDISFQQLGESIEKSHLFMRSINEKHELRLHHLDAKRAQAEQRLDKKAKDLAIRMIYLENKVNSLNKILSGERYRPLSTFEKRIGRAITVLRKEGLITTAAYSRKLRVSRTVSRNDLKKMTGMKITKKRGTGRNAYYILAV